MSTIIPMQTIRESLAMIARRAEQGEEFVVIRNSRPSFRIVPIEKNDTQYTADIPVRTLRDMTAAIDAAASSDDISEDEVDRIIHEIHGKQSR